MFLFKVKKDKISSNDTERFLAYDDNEYIVVRANLLFSKQLNIISFDDYNDMIKFYKANKSVIKEDTDCEFKITELLTGNDHDIPIS